VKLDGSLASVWGSTPEERRMRFPCDRYLSGIDGEYFRAKDVGAPAAVLFRWLCQLKVALSRTAARALLLAAQDLEAPPRRPATKDDVLGSVRRMGVLQIDSIAVVARSPYLVLWSRLGPYEPRCLDGLLAEGALFEYWSHAACLIPIEDYGLYRRLMLEAREKTRA
jgi:hypothetical protein